jgi:hypothetical protein
MIPKEKMKQGQLMLGPPTRLQAACRRNPQSSASPRLPSPCAIFSIQRIQKSQPAFHFALHPFRIESRDAKRRPEVRGTGTTKHKGLKDWLMLDLFERKIRFHMQRIFEACGDEESRELEDWLKAQAEVLRTLNAG